ncbi:hypothetical protein ABXW19_12425, partial [Streptococcus suis]|uniref:hypothetical protein n=1 Tax=Streptococcus suis TaxID=1307 RepID=UPI003CEAE9DF
MKRNAIRIIGRRPTKGKDFAEWFVFAKSATLLEDWYHALLHASMLPADGAAAAPVPGAAKQTD